MSEQNETKKHINLQKAYNLSSPEDNVNFYRSWAEDYDTDFAGGMDYILPYQVATQFIKLNGKGPVLDVGAGTGLLGIEISKLSKIEMHATDISEEMLLVAEKKGIYSKSIVGDLTKGLPILDNTYNGIVSSGTFTHGHVGPEALFEITRILSKGGLAVLSVNSKHWHSLGFDDVLEMLKETGLVANVTEVRIYGDKCEADTKDDTAYLLTLSA